MEDKLSSVAKMFAPSPIQQLSLLAQRFNAINLAEGFPDFPAPPHLKAAAVSAISSDFNQYRFVSFPNRLYIWMISTNQPAPSGYNCTNVRHVQGICDHLAANMKDIHGLHVDPLTDIAICCGQTEAFAAAAFAVIERGDEVLLFDPSYETYEGCIRIAGGVPVYVPLEPPYWTFDSDKLMKCFTERTKAVVLNSPHNPTGKVFSKEELQVIADACCKWNCLAITDEVYEHITYDNIKHISIATLPGMQERTILTSSLSKSFSVTGWRVGWAIAPAVFASVIRNIHIRITDSAPAPFQEAALAALTSSTEYFESLRSEYGAKRDVIVQLLTSLGFHVQFKPQGSFFLFEELPRGCLLSDVEYVEELITQAGVVAVPGRGFFHRNLWPDQFSNTNFSNEKRYIRFAFCKSDATLAAAAQKLGDLIGGARCFKPQ